MRIERFDPAADQRRLRACFEVMEAGRPYDDPDLPGRSFGGFSAWWRQGFTDSPRQAWLGLDEAGAPVGCYLLMLPERENPRLASCVLTIAPGKRRSGLGTELLAHCARQARQAGRSRLTSEARDGAAGAAFAAAAGATRGIAEVYRVLRVDDGIWPRLRGLRAEAERHASGYSVLSWLGACPEEFVDGLARLNTAMADAPRNPGIEPEVWDAGRIRKVERVAEAAGFRDYSVAARHDQTGALAAITQLGIDPGIRGWGLQMLTAVLPGHRGHRLGLLLKIAMLEQLPGQEPEVRRILTGNAGPNDHMIAINLALGFEVVAVHRTWELDLTGPLPG